ncbi:MAG: Gx transporter family protein, partial [Clostridia bacterium]|nr:Gx transporter family protein [Clostridia bacterium]
FALFTRGATAAVMSLCGGMLSTAVMCILIKKEGKNLSYIGIGVLSAAMHNMGQLAASCFITGTASLMSYGKYLLLFGLVTGFVTGTVLEIVLPKIRKIINQNFNVKEK